MTRLRTLLSLLNRKESGYQMSAENNAFLSQCLMQSPHADELGMAIECLCAGNLNYLKQLLTEIDSLPKLSQQLLTAYLGTLDDADCHVFLIDRLSVALPADMLALTQSAIIQSPGDMSVLLLLSFEIQDTALHDLLKYCLKNPEKLEAS
eukprot:COSAG01_NODE_37298_length_505_cov_1.123153_1_plen_149_part_01